MIIYLSKILQNIAKGTSDSWQNFETWNIRNTIGIFVQ